MLKYPLAHPEILSALASAGHLAKVLISDAHYPHSTKPNPRAKIVYANFAPGVVDANTLLKLMTTAIAIEDVMVMQPERTGAYAMTEDPPIWSSYRATLNAAGFEKALIEVDKPTFNQHARSDDVCLVIASGETAMFANLLLTIGVARQ